MHVTTVVVSHHGSVYLPRVLRALDEQTRQPDRNLGVDAGSQDGSPELLEDAFGRLNVLRAGPQSGFGEAVSLGLAELGTVEAPAVPVESQYLWLLHDDAAPEPEALAELLHAVERAPSVTVAGCKQVDWARERNLVDVGLSASRKAERLTMIEFDEQDQGQYDGRSDVFAVNSAGMLVRRDVWDSLGGFDPALPGPGDDIDFCWRNRLTGNRVVVVPSAVVHHAQDRPGALAQPTTARTAEVHTRLKHAPWWKLPLLWTGALLNGLWWFFAGFLFKYPGHGWRQFTATVRALFRFGAISRSRTSARKTKRLSRSVVRALQVDARDVRTYRRAVGESMLGVDEDDDDLLDSGNEFEPSGDAQQDFVSLATTRRLWIGTGAIAAAVVLMLAGIIALTRFIGAEALTGAALLPASSALGQIWYNATFWWSELGAGWPGSGEPFDFVIWLMGLIGFGNASQTIVWLFLLALPLAGLGAWFCIGALTSSRWARFLAALLWGASPVLLIAIGEGRIGALLAHLVIPWAFLGFFRALGAARSRRTPVLISASAGQASRGRQSAAITAKPGTSGRVSWTAAAATGLLLALLTASAPSLFPLAALIVLLLLAFGGRRARTLWWTLLPSVAVYVPFALTTFSNPRALLVDPGLPLPFQNAPSWLQLLGQPTAIAWSDGLPGMPWLPTGVPWAYLAALIIGAPLVVMALAALLWPHRASGTVRIFWGVTLGALVTAFVAGLIGTGAALQNIVTPFSGPAVSVAIFAVLCSAMIGLGGLRERSAQYTGRAFARRSATVFSVLLLLAPVVSLGGWIVQNQSGSPLAVQPGSQRLLPATASDRGLSEDRTRTLVLSTDPDGQINASLMRGAGTSLDTLSSDAIAADVRGWPGAETVTSGDAATETIRSAVAAIVAGTGADPRPQLNSLGAGFLVLRQSDTSAELLAGQIDAVPGLAAVGLTDQGWLWRVTSALPGGEADVIAALRTEDAQGRTLNYLPMTGTAQTDTSIPPGPEGRLLVLAERADSGWSAWLDGQPLERATGQGTASWAQAFALPERGGDLEIRYFQPWAPLWGIVQIVILALTLLLAIPMPARSSGRTLSAARMGAPRPPQHVVAEPRDAGLHDDDVDTATKAWARESEVEPEGQRHHGPELHADGTERAEERPQGPTS
ncbi:glycosyltransferase family 2 protein [Acaricomes phytoseiuli]|uniref:glycosyltransferase family 2 protein n=1 Tax=Acaricomes phytoseiuli TaxID=291968 RepID=UPI0022234B63|nr:glycosyltransferase family 2 protein [Acaricomes phytoseiuli]MCW1249873.1 glycosyltransferase family 2 protein [Acaricomes phytoseiuli]